jgi:hypothetical protein
MAVDRTPLPDPFAQPLVSITQAAACLGMSRRSAYRAVKALELPTVTLGTRKVSTRALYALLDQPLPAQPGAPRVVTLMEDNYAGGEALNWTLSAE